MTTKRDLVKRALGEMGMGDYVFDATPEEYADGKCRLDDIAAELDGQTIRVGYNLGGGIDDSAGIPDTARKYFGLALALNWAASFGKSMPQTKVAEAAAAWNALYVSRALRPTVAMPANMPYGTGYRDGVQNRQYFPESDGTVDGLDADATDY